MATRIISSLLLPFSWAFFHIASAETQRTYFQAVRYPFLSFGSFHFSLSRSRVGNNSATNNATTVPLLINASPLNTKQWINNRVTTSAMANTQMRISTREKSSCTSRTRQSADSQSQRRLSTLFRVQFDYGFGFCIVC